MANVQHIFTSDADPMGVAPPGSHHINNLNGDIWLYGDEWKRIYVGGSEGNVAFYGGYNAPVAPPIGPSIYTQWGGGLYAVFIAVYKSGEYWGWVQVSATDVE
ncbi:MAG: hypothetical protein RBR22_13150 [Desulfuromonas sp.]|nr:hypothetical protein [Desulfuromonas sp.]